MKKKVYITSLHLKHGGVEMAITMLANALCKRGYEVEILCTYYLGEPSYALDERVAVTYLTDVVPNREAVKVAVKSRNVFRIVQEGLYAVRVLHLKKSTMKKKIRSIQEGTIIATRNDHVVLLSKYGNKNVKKIAQLHHDHQFDKKLLRDFRDNYSNIDYFVLLTESVKREISQVMAENKHTELTVIPNFLPDVKQDISGEKKKQVIAVGRLHEVKGFLRLLDIWKAAEIDNHIVLKIVGDGEQFSEIKNRIRSLGLDNRVVLTGALEHSQVMEEMKKSLLYAMTSYTEAFPYVLIEAMSAGLPVVAYDVRVGPGAIVTEGETGFLIKDGNKKEFGNKMKRILEDDLLRMKLAENAQKKAQFFSEKAVMPDWINVLEACCK